MRYFASIVYLSVAIHTLAQSTILSPGQTGNSDNTLPFATLRESSTRYQQVYGSADFSALPPGGGLLTAISFRYSSSGFQLGGVLSNAQVNFSTTLRPVDGLSTTFAQNVGADDQIAIGPGPLNLINPGLGLVTVPLTTPFYYNPANGNLLMDVRVFSGYPTTGDPSMSASSFGFDRSSRVYADGVGNATGTADTIGLITGFQFTSVPEPSTTALFLVALTIASLFGIHHNQPNRKE